MAKTFPLEVVTPERGVFSEDVTGLVIPAHEGYLGVLAGHAPLLCTIRTGEAKILQDGKDKFFATSGGFLEVNPEKAILLCETFESSEEIDRDRADKAQARARERLDHPDAKLDSERARSALARAANRLRVADKSSK